jgi:hypothetical protein
MNALTGLSNLRTKTPVVRTSALFAYLTGKKYRVVMVPPTRFELVTPALRMLCSTN